MKSGPQRSYWATCTRSCRLVRVKSRVDRASTTCPSVIAAIDRLGATRSNSQPTPLPCTSRAPSTQAQVPPVRRTAIPQAKPRAELGEAQSMANSFTMCRHPRRMEILVRRSGVSGGAAQLDALGGTLDERHRFPRSVPKSHRAYPKILGPDHALGTSAGNRLPRSARCRSEPLLLRFAVGFVPSSAVGGPPSGSLARSGETGNAPPIMARIAASAVKPRNKGVTRD